MDHAVCRTFTEKSHTLTLAVSTQSLDHVLHTPQVVHVCTLRARDGYCQRSDIHP